MSVVDAAVVTQLGSDLGDAAFVDRLVATYRRMLPGRVQRVLGALEAGDHDALMDAVLSLRTSAAMVGAVALASLARDIEQHVRRAEPAAARRAGRQLASTAEQTCRALAGVDS